MNGNWADEKNSIVGAAMLAMGLALALTFACPGRHVQSIEPCLQEKLVSNDIAERDGFGWVVAIDGDLVAIGTTTNQGRGENSYSVYVFRRDGIEWIQEVKLTAPAGFSNDFGISMAIRGNLLAVGSGGDSDDSPGFVLTYRRAQAPPLWRPETIIPAPESFGSREYLFGRAVDITLAKLEEHKSRATAGGPIHP